jgi:hypothetical protein
MSLSNMEFTPPGGLKDASYSPTTPVSEEAIRAQIQGISDQLRDYLNSITPKLYTKTEIDTIVAGVILGQLPAGTITDFELSNVAGQVKPVLTQLVKDINSWKTYNNITELGLVAGTETMEAICTAMPDKSILRFVKLVTNTSTAYPYTSGVLEVIRHSRIRVQLKFTKGYGGAEEWLGFYDVDNMVPPFSGWIKRAMLDVDGNLITSKKILFSNDDGFDYNDSTNVMSVLIDGFTYRIVTEDALINKLDIQLWGTIKPLIRASLNQALVNGVTSGIGVTFGAGGVVIIGAGESATTIDNNGLYATTDETLVLAADNDIHFYTGCNAGDLAGAKKYVLDNTTIPITTEKENFIKIINELYTENNYVRYPAYVVATGSATAYVATLTPAPTSYVNGMGLVVKINVANTGACTINVNGLGAKSIKDPSGAALVAGALKLNASYAIRYDSVSGTFMLQG